MKINRKIGVILLLVIVLPAFFFSIYQIGSLNQNEKIIEEIYNNQLDVILSSVNQYSDDVASTWAFKMNNLYSTPQHNIYTSLQQFIHHNPSMKGVFYTTDTSYKDVEIVLQDYNLSILNQRKVIGNIIHQNTKKVNKLYLNLRGGYRKIEPFSSPQSSNLLYFVFAADDFHGQRMLCGMIVDVHNFVNQVLSPKIQAIVQEQFIISVLNVKERRVIYSSEPRKYYQISTVKPLWLLPDMKLGIIYKGKTIEELVRHRTYTNFALILLLDILFICGTWFVFRSIKKEIQLAQMRTDFISNISHEIRTPLALISVYIETIMLGRSKAEKLNEYYGIIHEETGRLTSIVNKILNFSKMEEKKFKYNFGPLSLNDLGEAIIHRYDFHLKNREFVVDIKLEKDLPLINGDRDALTEVLLNLVDNAIKYSANEKYVAIETISDENNVSMLISDKGIGIPEAQQKYVFDKFFRVADNEVQQVKGSGLGLSIVKNIIDAHNGTISLHSISGKGTTFKVVFKRFAEKENSPTKISKNA